MVRNYFEVETHSLVAGKGGRVKSTVPNLTTKGKRGKDRLLKALNDANVSNPTASITILTFISRP